MRVINIRKLKVHSLLIATLLAGLALALPPAVPVRAAVYPCTEAGLDAALAAGGGPHTFDCHTPTTITLTSTKVVTKDVILDGEDLLTISGDDAMRVLDVDGGDLELRRMVITGGYAGCGNGYGGGIIVQSKRTLTLENVTVQYNRALNGGGGIFIFTYANAIIFDSKIENNGASTGGGIASSGTVEIGRSSISENEVEFSGGGIANNAAGTLFIHSQSEIKENSARDGAGINNTGSLELSRVSISGNTATNYGGGIMNAHDLIVAQGDVQGNSALHGGGIFSGSSIHDATVVLEESAVNGNSVSAYGGGIAVYGGTLTLQISEVIGNSATSKGGGFYTYDDTTVEIDEGTILDNSAEEGGGFYTRGDLSITDSTIGTSAQPNTADDYGGGLYSKSGRVNIDSSDIEGNRAELQGGGIYSEGGRIDIESSDIEGNGAGLQGGGIYNEGARMNIYSSNIEINRANLEGGGIYNAADGLLMLLETTRLLYNPAGESGGGAYNLGMVRATQICIVGNTDTAVYSYKPAVFDAPGVWWGAADGPSGDGPGSGDSVTAHVQYTPWLTEPLPGCP